MLLRFVLFRFVMFCLHVFDVSVCVLLWCVGLLSGVLCVGGIVDFLVFCGCVSLCWFMMLCGLFRVLCVACFWLYRVSCLCSCRKRPDVSVVLCSVVGFVLLFELLCVALFCVIMCCDVLVARI